MTETRSKGGFALGDYVEVKDRIALFLAQYPDGRLLTERVELWQDDGVPRIVVKALAYRTVDDPHPGTGWSWMALPGSTSYTRGSELENTETSAWGRAIGCLGIGIGKSIASGDEVRGKAGESERKHPGLVDGDPDDAPNPDGSLIGTVAAGKPPTDLQLRQTPDGPLTGFVLTQGRSRLQVVATGPLADGLHPFLTGLVGQRVTCWGTVDLVPWQREGRDMPPFKRLSLERIVTADFILPADVAVEAASIPLFSDEEAAAILAAELVEAS